MSDFTDVSTSRPAKLKLTEPPVSLPHCSAISLTQIACCSASLKQLAYWIVTPLKLFSVASVEFPASVLLAPADSATLDDVGPPQKANIAISNAKERTKANVLNRFFIKIPPIFVKNV